MWGWTNLLKKRPMVTRICKVPELHWTWESRATTIFTRQPWGMSKEPNVSITPKLECLEKCACSVSIHIQPDQCVGSQPEGVRWSCYLPKWWHASVPESPHDSVMKQRAMRPSLIKTDENALTRKQSVFGAQSWTSEHRDHEHKY